MPSPSVVSSLVSAIRWIAIVFGCVFAADSAVDGSVGSVVAIGLATLVGAWWTLRDDPVDRNQDLAATVVLAAAALLADPSAAFLPAIVVSIGVANLAAPYLEEPEVTVDAVTHVARAMGEQTPAEKTADLAHRIEAEERRRAVRVTSRVGEWLTYTKTGLDRHLTRRPDRQLAELRDDVNDAIREVEERTRQLKARITPSMPLSAHAGRVLEWWSEHYGAEVTLQVGDPADRLDESTEQALLTVMLEAVDNAGRHGQAEHLTVAWEVDGDAAELRVTDDGVGFEAGSTTGAGLTAMARAADRIGADFSILSSPDRGCDISVRVAASP